MNVCGLTRSVGGGGLLWQPELTPGSGPTLTMPRASVVQAVVLGRAPQLPGEALWWLRLHMGVTVGEASRARGSRCNGDEVAREDGGGVGWHEIKGDWED